MTFKNVYMLFIFILISLLTLAENNENKKELPKDPFENEISDTIMGAMRTDKSLDPDVVNFLYEKAPVEFKDYIEFIKIAESYKGEQQAIQKDLAPKRLLLVGPPGTGKSTLAQIVATKLERPLYFIRTPMLANEYQNSAISNLRRILMDAIAKKKPCVIIFDEINALLSQPDSRGQNENLQIGSVLWLLLDRCANWPHILIIGTCNDISQLPPQLRDRFEGNVIEITRSGLNDRFEILCHYFSQHNYEFDSPYIYKLAKRTSDFSNRQLEALVTMSYRNQVIRCLGDIIREEDVQKALTQFQTGAKILHPRFQNIKNWLKEYAQWLPAATGTLNLTLLIGTICYSIIHNKKIA